MRIVNPTCVLVGRGGQHVLRRDRIPIVFVPGVMGSRLYFPTIRQYWDPDNIWRMLYWIITPTEKMGSDLDISNPAQVIENEAGDAPADRVEQGWGTVAWDFYGNLLRYLEELFKSSQYYKCPVYAVGYDWRQSNYLSAEYVAKKIRTTLECEKAENLIVVTHSMGGLVTRAMFKRFDDITKKTLGVIHVTQPVDGAVAMYRRFHTGMTLGEDGFVMQLLAGNTGKDFAAVVRGTRGPMQLLPTNNYRDIQNERPWLNGAWLLVPPSYSVITADDTTPAVDTTPVDPYPWRGDIYDLYASPEEKELARITRWYKNELKKGIANAKNFHLWLGRYKHPNTWSIYSTGIETDVAVYFNSRNSSGKLIIKSGLTRRKKGDGTVPASSAAALFPDQHHTYAPNIHLETARQFVVHGVKHDKACNNKNVQDIVGKIIYHILGIC